MLTIKNENVVSADLLSVEEVKDIPKWIRANGEWWRVRTNKTSDETTEIDSNGAIGYLGSGSAVTSVRPALQIANLPQLKIGETIEVFGLMAQYIGNDKILLCKMIFYHLFKEKNLPYETSEIKQKIDKWFNDNKGVNKNE